MFVLVSDQDNFSSQTRLGLDKESKKIFYFFTIERKNTNDFIPHLKKQVLEVKKRACRQTGSASTYNTVERGDES